MRVVRDAGARLGLTHDHLRSAVVFVLLLAKRASKRDFGDVSIPLPVRAFRHESKLHIKKIIFLFVVQYGAHYSISQHCKASRAQRKVACEGTVSRCKRYAVVDETA